MEIYLDNSATTVCAKEVIDKMMQVYSVDYGNPSAMHQKGVDAERYILAAAEQIAKTLKVSPKEIIFTSGGTESNNLAIIGSALANKRSGNRILTTKIEHPSVARAMDCLTELGFEVIALDVLKTGEVSMDALKEAMNKDTILVSTMMVNNEIGSVNPVEEIGAYIKSVNPHVIYHVDAVQGYGKMLIRPKKSKIDLLSVSGHKIHGPKGAGFLYVKEKTKIKPLMLGGGQQEGLRSGTENVPGIAGLGEAARLCNVDLKEKMQALHDLRNTFAQQLSEIEGLTINGPLPQNAAPHIISVSCRGVRSEVLLHVLEEKGIYVSAGSACSSHKRAPSETLSAIGLEKDLLESTVRLSLDTKTTRQELDVVLDVLKEQVPQLRKYARY